MPHRISVLLVDDSSAFLRIAERFLNESSEVRVVGVALGGLHALPLARDLQPDAIVVDLQMPDLNGLELIPLLRTALPEARIIALTFHDDSLYRNAALRAGADDFVAKGNMGNDLLPAIRNVVKRDA
ncbi:MAG: response regulator transcription factor [Armatimonadetes bacterium]|nr:response regulator transcription factor [Armatimonadota bacterium]